MWIYSLFLLQILLRAPCSVQGEAHPHQGVVPPFKVGDPGVKLDKKALSVLSSGKPFTTQIQYSDGGRGLVVQDVKAPVETVWDRILDFDHYNKMVPKTVESKIYKTEKVSGKQKRIWVRMKIGLFGLKLQFFVNHLYDPSKNSMIWTLDYSQKSDFDDSVGYWYVTPHPEQPSEWSRVYYSVQVSMFPWVPHFVVDFMSKQALTDATAWVKKYSELEAAKRATATTKTASDAASSGENDEKTRRPWWRPQQQKPHSHRGGATDGNAKAMAATVAENASEAAMTEGPKGVTVTRLALVSTVLALTFYNIHLYFSQ